MVIERVDVYYRTHTCIERGERNACHIGETEERFSHTIFRARVRGRPTTARARPSNMRRRYKSFEPALMRSQLASLPNDIVPLILELLPLRCLVVAARVSHTFKAAASPRLEEERRKMLDKWTPRLKALRAQASIANKAAIVLADDVIAHPTQVMWAGGVQAAVGLLQRFSLTSLCARNAAAILFNMSHTQEFALPLVSCGGVELLVRMLTLSKPSGEPACGRAAKFAAMTLSNCLAEGTRMECVRAVKRALHMVDVVPRLVQLLDIWAKQSDDDDEPLPSLQGIHPLASLLWGMAHRSKESAIVLGAAGTAAKALSLLENSESSDVRYVAAGLLCNLVAGATENARLVLSTPGGMELLRRLVRSDTAKPSPGLVCFGGEDDTRTIQELVQYALAALDDALRRQDSGDESEDRESSELC